jgi:YbbR domain-containing protein
MNQVVEVRASLDVTGANDNVVESVTVRPLNENRQVIRGVTITPPSVTISQPVILQGGYRNVVVKVVTNGEVADGYWLTNVSVTPPNVTVFSTNPQAVNELPGYVETNPIDLTELSDDVDIRATLNLPEGVTLAGEESVLVRLSIAALEGSLPINLPVEIVGLSPEYRAVLSPDTVDLLLVGPLTILNNLTPASIRVSVDLSGLEPGAHQVPVVVDLLPNEVNVASIIPDSVGARIEVAPTPTPTSDEPTTQGSELTPTVTPSVTSGS